MRLRTAWALGLLAGLALAAPAGARPPAAIAEQIKQLGRVVDPAGTSRIYLPLQPGPTADVVITREVAYGPGPKNTLDVFTPAKAHGGKRPILIFVHGGGFVTGDKVMAFEGKPSPFYDNVLLWAVHQGMVGVNANYSLAPGAKFPVVQNELGQVLAWARANAARLGGDPDRIILWGNSAGAGHVAAYLADPAAYGGQPVAGAILSSGVYDLRDLATRPPGSAHPYFGDQAAWSEHNIWPALLKTKTPLLVTVNEWDPENVMAAGVKLNKALCDAGRCPAYSQIAGHGHVSATYSLNTGDDTMAKPVLSFLKSVR